MLTTHSQKVPATLGKFRLGLIHYNLKKKGYKRVTQRLTYQINKN